jgi:hypothetical protein
MQYALAFIDTTHLVTMHNNIKQLGDHNGHLVPLGRFWHETNLTIAIEQQILLMFGVNIFHST